MWWVYQGARESDLLEDVIVATDDSRIYHKGIMLGIKNMVMTGISHKSGTDRCEEAIRMHDKIQDQDVVINIQGDEPLICADVINAVVNVFQSNNKAKVVSLYRKIDDSEAMDPNIVKVALSDNQKGIYFSRAPVPANAEQFHGHVGIYGYTVDALTIFSNSTPTRLEMIEKLEQLRFIENGMEIYMAETKSDLIAVDKPDDIVKVENRMIANKRAAA